MTDPASRPAVLAHRGGSEGRENSVDAIRRAVEAGADGVEIDIQIGADGRPLAKHDLDRDGSDGADEARADGAGLAPLRDVVAVVEELRCSLLIDFKSGGDPVREAAILAEALDGITRPELIQVSSFSVPFLEALAPLVPGLALFPIVSLRQNFPRPDGLDRWAGASVLAAALLANPFLLGAIRRRQGHLLVWFGATEWMPLLGQMKRLGAEALIVKDVASAVRSLAAD